MIAALFAGLAVGLVHVVAGPDHLGAIAPIASDERQRVWAVGLRWGLGHSLGAVLMVLLAVTLAHAALIDPVSHISERLVGVMLLIIAAWGFWRLGRSRVETTHDHGDGRPHTHASGSRRFGPYAIGILHGCAGGSHLVGILLALAFPTVTGVCTYLAGFVCGSVLAMCAFAAGIGWLGTIGGPSPRVHRMLMLLSSLASLLVGVWWLTG
jgi:hypothetical protein